MSPFPKQSLTVGGDDPFLPSLLSSINYATEIHITTAFIRFTGIQLIQDALIDALNRKVHVRILTGDYLGITDPKALRYLMLLQELGANVKVFESKGKHSFHMKAYLFCRSTNDDPTEGCAFIGSSNISQSALENGLEWNLKVDRSEDEPRFNSIMSEYNRLFDDSRCQILSHQWIDEYITRIPNVTLTNPIEAGADEVDAVPEPNEIQAEALAAISETRELGFRRGLVVMATGLGKTWFAAFDCQQINAKRVLFVAHREEILNQAEETYVRIRPELKVGRYNGKSRELNVDLLFASIQTLGKTQHLDQFPADYFDYIVVDEFHHAAARTYQRLLSHFSPRFLLGLTATPERTDQSDILALCDDNLVYSKDLFHGIEANLLCPFHYYGIADDTVNYQEIKWRNGKFDESDLVNQLATQARAKHNLLVWQKHCLTRTLAFCVSIKHADFMADYFRQHNIKAVSVHSNSETPRNEALLQLRKGVIQVVFSVDLFNEGVDLPLIDTVLMLRPTESKIIFLQQLGRGLRTCEGKEKLMVIDFIGNHISFFRKPEALFQFNATNKDRKQFIEFVEKDELSLPPGCFVNYDLQAIDFMKQLLSNRADQQLDLYLSLRDSLGRRPVLAEFFRSGGAVDTIRHEHGQWLSLVHEKNDLEPDEVKCLSLFSPFFRELEVTKLEKSFKLILLEALVEMEGFKSAPTTEQLSIKSFELLQRRRPLRVDLPKEYADVETLDSASENKWHKYWLKNPVKALAGDNKNNSSLFFSVVDNCFSCKLSIPDDIYSSFTVLVQEIINYRFLQYELRLANKVSSLQTRPIINKDDEQEIPFFSDLKIACGHFRTSQHETENIEYLSLPMTSGHLNPAKHFIARAKGDSMNGGSSPIHSGDYLLLEQITPNHASKLNGNIIAIEQQDVTGDDQYLLRKVNKISENNYELLALNLDYPPLKAVPQMNTFAKLKQVLDITELFLHHEFYKNEVAGLFGYEYKEGVWKMQGHICPKVTDDQFLFVTLNKQQAEANYRYHDYFIDQSHFHWQSQNSTTPDNAKGKKIVHSNDNEASIYLFVRKHPKSGGQIAPFIFCGRVIYLKHADSAPMNVEFELEDNLTAELFDFFAN